MKPLVSIILANYNRAGLIEETLDSIRRQTYSNFECLIIDDQSTDNSNSMILRWIKRDKRFKYYRRPDTIKKGANACRNWGFKQSNGELIKFFDSDDIMLPKHLEASVDYIQRQKLDFVVVDCQNFDKDGLRERPYETNKDHVKISPLEFATFQNGWITNDLILNRQYAKQIVFNEDIRDVASEFQYALKLLCLTNNGITLPDILTYRRIHDQSTFLRNNTNEIAHYSNVSETKLCTAIYLKNIGQKTLLNHLLNGYMADSMELAKRNKIPILFIRSFPIITKIKGLKKLVFFILGVISYFFIGRGYYLYKFATT